MPVRYHRRVMLLSTRRLAVAGLLVATSSLAVAAETASEKTWKRIRDHVLPDAKDTRWQKIPWRASLWDAVIDANRERKPILLWAMNGHPLGCT